MKINKFENGMNVTVPLLINTVTKGVTQNGAPYLSILFQDNTGNIEGKWWDVNPELEKLVVPGAIATVKCDVLLYRQNLQIRVQGMNFEGDYQVEEFSASSPFEKEFLIEKITGFVNMIENPVYKQVVEACFKVYGDDFYLYPAATRNHHDFVGGLATHVYTMGLQAITLKEIYPSINLDLLLSGVLVHDMGKIEEYTQAILSQYSTQGKLLGHISMMHGVLYDVAKELDLVDTEEVMLLRHLVLSHHGQLEYGSPVRPMVLEAELLNFIDNIDARMNMFEKLITDTDAGAFSPRVFALENRSFYIPKDTKK